MVIAGTTVPTFEEANYATLSRYFDDVGGGKWKPASTNQTWVLFWSELDSYDGETVEFTDRDETLQIQEDDRGEFVVLEQDRRGVLGRGTYRTRFRPYRERNTERKPWNPQER